MAVLEAKTAEYRRVRKLRQAELGKANITVSKTGEIIDVDILGEPPLPGLASNQIVIEVMRDQRRLFYQGNHISVPTTFAGRQFHRTITDTEFLLSDPDTAEVVLSFPLPLTAMHARGKFIASYSIRGIVLKNPTKQWERKAIEYREQFILREAQAPEVFIRS